MKKKRTVEGVVTAFDWDQDDEVVAVSIVTEDDEVIVDDYGDGELLLDYIGETVKVTGKVYEDDDESLHIKVKCFEHCDDIIDDEDEDEDDYEEDVDDLDEDSADDEDDDDDDDYAADDDYEPDEDIEDEIEEDDEEEEDYDDEEEE